MVLSRDSMRVIRWRRGQLQGILGVSQAGHIVRKSSLEGTCGMALA